MNALRIAHLNIQGIDVAIFAADAQLPTRVARADLLVRLTARARMSGLKIDKAALAYIECGRTRYFGTPDLVEFLAAYGVSQWTHRLAL
jgi:hypothetical protein